MAILDLVSRLVGIALFTVGMGVGMDGSLALGGAIMAVGLFLGLLTAVMQRILERPGGPWEDGRPGAE